MNEARSANATIQNVLEARKRATKERYKILGMDNLTREAKQVFLDDLEAQYKREIRSYGIDTYDSKIEALQAKIKAYNERFKLDDELVRAANLIKAGEVPAGTLERITSGKSPLEIEYLYNVANESKRTRAAIDLKGAMEAARFVFEPNDQMYFVCRTSLAGKVPPDTIQGLKNTQMQLERVDDLLTKLETNED